METRRVVGAVALLLLGACRGAEDGQEWREVPLASLDDAQRARWTSADGARKAAAARIFGELTRGLAAGGPAGAVSACKDGATRATAEAAAEHHVKLGRTAQRLRNPANTPPPWAAAAVEAGASEPRVFLGPDGAVGLLEPIRTAALCVQCHGEPAALTEGVAEALRRDYPQDQAVGFAEGDLRGWFWVEKAGG